MRPSRPSKPLRPAAGGVEGGKQLHLRLGDSVGDEIGRMEDYQFTYSVDPTRTAHKRRFSETLRSLMDTPQDGACGSRVIATDVVVDCEEVAAGPFGPLQDHAGLSTVLLTRGTDLLEPPVHLLVGDELAPLRFLEALLDLGDLPFLERQVLFERLVREERLRALRRVSKAIQPLPRLGCGVN